MRVLLTSASRYPARFGGNGSSRAHDGIAKGLAELGHEVLYSVREGIDGPLPPGVRSSPRNVTDADIYHYNDYPIAGIGPPAGKPWIRTYQAPLENNRANVPLVNDHFVFVSSAHARSYGMTRYVWNGIDPAEFFYSEEKGDYLLFIVSALRRGEQKGLRIAIEVAERTKTRLIVGADVDLDPLPGWMQSNYVDYRGEIMGEEKALLLASARALINPTQVTEPFGLVTAEALISGTPVIGSRNGACPELISDDVGFICDTIDEYAAAVERVDAIDPAACRRRAMTEFHYRVMAQRYLDEYEVEMARNAG
jgi:glycosyltransferase involved in cell wall biosynthesis